MWPPSEQHVRAYLETALPNAAPRGSLAQARLAPRFTPTKLTVTVRAAADEYVLECFAPAAHEGAARAAAGLRLAGGLGLAPELAVADLEGAALGGATLLLRAALGPALADRPIGDADAERWLFLLLTLHHLLLDPTEVPRAPSGDLAAWWRDTQTRWDACHVACAGAPLSLLCRDLERLHAIAGVRVTTHLALWQAAPARLCHGQPTAWAVHREGERLVLCAWEHCGLGDPAMDIVRALLGSMLDGLLTPVRFERMLASYLRAMADTRDAALDERARVFGSLSPLGVVYDGVCALVRQGASQDAAAGGEEPRHAIASRVTRALAWLRDALGVTLDDAAAWARAH